MLGVSVGLIIGLQCALSLEKTLVIIVIIWCLVCRKVFGQFGIWFGRIKITQKNREKRRQLIRQILQHAFLKR